MPPLQFLFHGTFQKLLNGKLQRFGQTVERFSGALFNVRLPAAKIIQRSMRDTAQLRNAIFRHAGPIDNLVNAHSHHHSHYIGIPEHCQCRAYRFRNEWSRLFQCTGSPAVTQAKALDSISVLSYCECTLRRISYRPRRGKLPSVCWQLPGRFRTPRSIYAVAFYTATRVIYGTTGLAFSLRDHILPPGRPLCGSLIILKSGVMACEAMLLSASSVSR